MKCAVHEVNERPLSEKLAALAASRVAEKVKPSLEVIAEMRQRRKDQQKKLLANSMR